MLPAVWQSTPGSADHMNFIFNVDFQVLAAGISLGCGPPAGRHGELLARQANASPHHHCQPGGAYSVVIMLRDQVAIFSGVC